MTETPQSSAHSTDPATATPFHLHAPYASAYTHPAFLLSFGTPPHGALRFPHIPQTALITESRQVRRKSRRRKKSFPEWTFVKFSETECETRFTQKRHSIVFLVSNFLFYRKILVSSTCRISCIRNLITTCSPPGREPTEPTFLLDDTDATQVQRDSWANEHISFDSWEWQSANR